MKKQRTRWARGQLDVDRYIECFGGLPRELFPLVVGWLHSPHPHVIWHAFNQTIGGRSNG